MSMRSYVNGHEGHPHFLSREDVETYKQDLKNDHFTLFSDVLRALSDNTKLKILMLLDRVDEMVVSDIVTILGGTQSAMSHALADLKALGLLSCSRCGKLQCYSLTSDARNNPLVRSIFREISQMKGGETHE